MLEILHYIQGSIPGGILPLLAIFIVLLLALFYSKYRNPDFARSALYRRFAILGMIWLLFFGLLRINYPPKPLPIRLSVYPLKHNDNSNKGMSFQLARELEEAISSSNPYFSTGAFHRLSWQPIPASDIPDSIKTIPEKLQLDWLVTGEWISNDSVLNHLKLNLTLVQLPSYKEFEITSEGDPNDVLMKCADEIAIKTKKKTTPITFSHMSPQWRNACANSFEKSIDRTFLSSLFLNAYKSDSLCLSGISWWLQTLLTQNSQHEFYDFIETELIPKMLHLAETFPLFLISIGDFYRTRGEAEKAVSALLLAYHYAPTRPEPHYLLSMFGTSQIRTSFQKTTLDHIQRAVELDPGFEKARLRLLEFLNPSGLSRDLENYILPGLSIAPHSSNLLIRKSFFEMERFSPDTAIQTLNQVLRIDSTIGNAYYNRGISNLRKKDTLLAKIDFWKSLEKKGTIETNFYLGIIHENQSQWDSAIYYFGQRIKFAKFSSDHLATQRARDKLLSIIRTHRSSKLNDTFLNEVNQ